MQIKENHKDLGRLTTTKNGIFISQRL